MLGGKTRGYDPLPWYEPVGGGTVLAGWDALAERAANLSVLAIDGPELAPWAIAISALREALAARGIPARAVDARAGLVPWEALCAATTSAALAGDPDFEALPDIALAALVAQPVEAPRDAPGMAIIFGPGASLSRHDEIWYLGQPKRVAEAEVAAGSGRNLGQSDGSAATLRRLFYVDWPLLDRHRDGLAAELALWIDAQDAARPTALDGATLRATAAALAQRPLRTRPVFNSTPWGGHWGQRRLGLGAGQEKTAVGYELIAPESGVLIGDPASASVELPFQLLVSLQPEHMLGAEVHSRFGGSFPIRFDYLDTVGGGNLSVHCHPQPTEMREVFGWPYAQHETYYTMVAGEGSEIFLGLCEGADLEAFESEARAAQARAEPFEVRRHVQHLRARAHQLYLVPAGTPHGSGAGNVVLEISATPYLYSLRFYDWLRRDAADAQRPVHMDLAFRNLDADRRGPRVGAELVPEPRRLRGGRDWSEEVLGELPELFFDVRRLELGGDVAVPDHTEGRFHVLNVVEGAGVTITTDAGHRTELAYAETLVIPAAVGAYRLQRWGRERVRVVKALVR